MPVSRSACELKTFAVQEDLYVECGSTYVRAHVGVIHTQKADNMVNQHHRLGHGIPSHSANKKLVRCLTVLAN